MSLAKSCASSGEAPGSRLRDRSCRRRSVDAERPHHLVEDAKRPAVDVVAADHVIAGAQHMESVDVAPHPLPNAKPCFPPSSAAMHPSSAWRVGLPLRESKSWKACYELLDAATLDEDENSQIAALEHLAKIAKNPTEKGKVHVLAWRNRTLARERGSGRLNDSPDTKQQTDAAHAVAKDAPALILLRNNGTETDGWGMPFWWPVVVVPRNAVTSIFAGNVPAAT